ncbi:MAG: Rrf2 family transcriptional regulator [Bacteroidales bacterium]|nr:Rrf2 family transcriptional regulator [Bacteroidales bacterium]HNW74739.1 Rrf2 family transcriptional regulator [Bacteroidales bacterium]HPS51845.1 Rrf2 family transcriptional regulator [Bacteroidales bacterium]
MNFSKTTEYAIRVLTTMAIGEEKLYTADDLYEKLKIPKRYLRRLLTDLSKAGLIAGTRGRTGGFVFAKDPDKVTLKEIIDLVEGKETLNRCILGFSACVADGHCTMHADWIQAKVQMEELLTTTTLGSLNPNRK